MGPRYFSGDFDFGSVEFPFSGSKQGMPVARDTPTRSDNELGTGGYPERGFARGGHAKMPRAGGKSIPVQKVAPIVKAAAAVGSKLGAGMAKAGPPGGAMGAPMGAPAGVPAMGGPAMGGASPLGALSAGAPAMRRGGRVKAYADGGAVESDKGGHEPSMRRSPASAKPVMHFTGGDPSYDRDGMASAEQGARAEAGPTETGYRRGGMKKFADGGWNPGGPMMPDQTMISGGPPGSGLNGLRVDPQQRADAPLAQQYAAALMNPPPGGARGALQAQPSPGAPAPGPMLSGGAPATAPVSQIMMAKGGRFIKDAIKKPGQLHRDLGVPQGQPIPEGKLEAAAGRSGKVGQRARFAETLKGMNHKR